MIQTFNCDIHSIHCSVPWWLSLHTSSANSIKPAAFYLCQVLLFPAPYMYKNIVYSWSYQNILMPLTNSYKCTSLLLANSPKSMCAQSSRLSDGKNFFFFWQTKWNFFPLANQIISSSKSCSCGLQLYHPNLWIALSVPTMHQNCGKWRF